MKGEKNQRGDTFGVLWLAIGAAVLAIPCGYVISRDEAAWNQSIGWFNGWLGAAIVLEMRSDLGSEPCCFSRRANSSCRFEIRRWLSPLAHAQFVNR
jgi:hypothetical protein